MPTPNPYTSKNLNLSFIAPAQAMKHVTVNETIRALDALVHLSVAARDVTVPPMSPAEGTRYLIPANATEAWSDRTGEIAAWQDGAWAYFAPQSGWRLWCETDGALLVYQSGDWQAVTGTDALQNLTGLGIGTSSDSNNRLAVSSPATLLNHEGDDHRVKINKASSGDTASLLYQTDFSGRAEFGLTGDDDFHLKVSPDGSTWHDAIIVDRNTGLCRVEKIAFSATLSADQSGIGTSGVTKIDFDTAVFNTGGAYDTANARFQPPAGLYALTAAVHFTATENGARNSLVILKNGSVAYQVYRTSGKSISQGISIFAVVEANGTDYFEIGAASQLSSKTVRDTTSLTYFQGHAL